ncbi:GNAT family N-acetyltransferase [Hymenobacter aerilatus]|uniref:GNAT family N-acetyltransferase n=1 Tax=Hymenobacter aerilatus TaxID=2932251 RepID=A0A8T9T3L2_9BACT|nr:GNAT family N-acetyltransferase [Hymenobacter aerilatus]UOR06529.1 GNAT family N-acetyltransferase [Hymenobacter aerilatus]
MPHPLDNPIWNALCTGTAHLAMGNEQARYVQKEAGAFAGLREYSASAFADLHNLTPTGTATVLFTAGEVAIPADWKLLVQKDLLQLVYEHPTPPAFDSTGIVPLQPPHILAMLALTAHTNPGPFLQRTIEFGEYHGIFEGDELVAMAGERLQPLPYTELSAVCTHPAHLGKGYAARLLQHQMHRIMAAGRVPFLHVLPENTRARAVYERLGFQTRRQLQIYVLEKLVG